MPTLTSTVGRLGGDIMVNKVGDMARGSSAASDIEKGYLDAPYTQVGTPRRLYAYKYTQGAKAHLTSGS